jgi:hypothetical protein
MPGEEEFKRYRNKKKSPFECINVYKYMHTQQLISKNENIGKIWVTEFLVNESHSMEEYSW